MSNSSKRITLATNFIITYPLNHLMGYHATSIENTYCHQPPSTVTQSIGIYDHFRVSPICQSLLLISTQSQYPLKVESSSNIVAW